MTHSTRQRVRICAYIRHGPDSGEKEGVFIRNHGNFQKRKKMTTKSVWLEACGSEPTAHLGKCLFQAPSDQDETLESRAAAAGQMAATWTQRGGPARTQETLTGEEDSGSRGRIRHGLHPPGVDRPVPLREKQPGPGDSPTGSPGSWHPIPQNE